MNILIHASENTILEDIAQHLHVELGAPQLLYEIENANLAEIAIALGGSQLIEAPKRFDPSTMAITEEDLLGPGWDAPSDPASLVNTNPVYDQEIAGGTGKPCEICGKQTKSKRHKTCSPECLAESRRRYSRDYQRKLHDKVVGLRGKKAKPVETGDAESEPSPLSLSV